MFNNFKLSPKCLLSLLSLFLLIQCKSTDIKKPDAPVKVKTKTVFHKRYDDKKINFIIFSAWKSFKSKQYERAAMDFERLSTKKYNHYDVLFGAGISYMKYYDLKKAVNFFTMTLQKKPDHFDAIFYRAEIYLVLKNYTKARQDLEKLISLKKPAPFYCGLYKNDLATGTSFRKKQKKAHEILKSL